MIRLGYIYFTFFRFIDSKNYREYDIGFTNFLEYINFNIECDEPKKWYLLIMGFYKDYTEEHKDLIVSFFKMPTLHSILESYFDLCEKLYLKSFCPTPEEREFLEKHKKDILENDYYHALVNESIRKNVSAKLYSVPKKDD